MMRPRSPPGHRPCAECRRSDFDRFLEVWPGAIPRVAAIDERLHAERLTDNGRQRHHEAALADLPDGAFITRDDIPWLVHGDRLLRWTPAAYTESVPRPARDPRDRRHAAVAPDSPGCRVATDGRAVPASIGACRLIAPGAMPMTRLNARLNAASER